jgi:WD40 repeat protein/serine/threonine protein kinase
VSDSLLAQWIDTEADRFESLWRAGQVPDISKFLSDTPPDRRTALALELVQIDRAYRAQSGTILDWASYRAAAPELPMSPPEQESTDSLWPDIPGFEIIGRLGSDGMGVVYRARQFEPPRDVALKMLRGPSDAELLTRFRQETEAVARLQHPNIVQIFASGEHAGQPYMALELVEGGDLAERTGGQPQSERASSKLVSELARAIDFVHRQGIIHRDLKPANILLAGAVGTTIDQCTAKITDFGLAKFLDRDAGPSQTGSALGSPSYMAPEQASGRAKEATAAADVYGLGAILYVLLTGRPPFLGSSVLDTLDQVTRLEPVSPRRLRPTLPRDLETICLKCLRKAPEARYKSASELADDLARFLEGKPVVARPVSFAERGLRTVRRYPLVSGLIVAVAASLLIGSVVSALFAFESRKQEGIAKDKTGLAESKAEEARRNLYVAHMQLLDVDWKRCNLNRMHEVLDRYAYPTADEPDLRGWEWHFNYRRLKGPLRSYLNEHSIGRVFALSQDGKTIVVSENSKSPVIRVLDPRDFSEIRKWSSNAAPITAIAMLPDNRSLVMGLNDGAVFVMDIHSGKFLHRHRFASHVDQIIAAPDGRRFFVRKNDGEIQLVYVDESRPSTILPINAKASGAFTVSPNGRWLACSDDGKRALFFDLTVEPPAVKYEAPFDGPISTIAFSPDNKGFACGHFSGAAFSGSVGTNEPVVPLAGHSMHVGSVGYSSDGRVLFSGSDDLILRAWSTATNRQLLQFRGHHNNINHIICSPDHLKVFSVCAGGSIHAWSPAGVPDVRRVECDFGLFSMAYQPNGNLLAVGGTGSDVLLLDALTGRTIRRLPGHVPSVMGLAFNPTGATLATADADGAIRIWDSASGRMIRAIAAHKNRCDAVSFSPDGAMLASAGVDTVIRLWDAATGKLKSELVGHSKRIHGLAFNHDGRLLASASDDHTVRLWDLFDFQPKATLRGHTDWVYGVRFSPDRQRLISASHDRTIRIWNVYSATEQTVIRGHQEWVWPIDLSRDGKRLVTGSGDRLVKLWDMSTLQEVQSLDEHTGRSHLSDASASRVYAVAMSPDGHSIASGGDDGFLVIRHAEPWSNKVEVEREAVSVLDVLVERNKSALEIREILPTLFVTDEVRSRIQALLPRYFPPDE